MNTFLVIVFWVKPFLLLQNLVNGLKACTVSRLWTYLICSWLFKTRIFIMKYQRLGKREIMCVSKYTWTRICVSLIVSIILSNHHLENYFCIQRCLWEIKLLSIINSFINEWKQMRILQISCANFAFCASKILLVTIIRRAEEHGLRFMIILH